MATLTRADAEDFIFREARLLDEGRLTEWLSLFDADCEYWIPCGQADEPGPLTHLVRDGRGQLEDRVWQLQHPRRSSQNPRSTTIHLISNVALEGGDWQLPTIHSAMAVWETRSTQGGSGTPRCFVARVEHRMRWDGGVWRITRKTIWLLDRDLPIYNLTFLL